MIKRFRKNEKGQGLVEFALILPILLLLLVAIVDFGWMIFVKTNLNNAAREGARVYAVNESEDEAKAAAASYLGFLPDSYTISIATTKSTTESTTELVDYNQSGICTVSSDVNPLVGLIFSNPLSMESSAQMRLEYVFEIP